MQVNEKNYFACLEMELFIVFDKCSSPDYGEEPKLSHKVSTGRYWPLADPQRQNKSHPVGWLW